MTIQAAIRSYGDDGSPGSPAPSERSERGDRREAAAFGCPQVRFEAYSTTETPNILWASADDAGCMQAEETVTYTPGETKIFAQQWNQSRCDNSRAPGGQHMIGTQDATECWARVDKERPFTLRQQVGKAKIGRVFAAEAFE